MVCTLLAGFNVVAFAADDETVSVAKFYNDAKKGGDGEHLFTKDADEISWLSSLPTWNNEGEAWKAPVASLTEVYRCYNPNSGEHLYVDEDYADYLAATGWNKEKLAFYSDDDMGVPVYRLWNGAAGVGCHHYTTDEGEVSYLVAQGWTKEDVAFYGVADASNVVTLVDAQGLQADGTALLGDTLAIVFGSNFGTPASVAWYKDGAVVKVITSDIAANALTFDTASTLGGTGTYYAVVENTKGQSFTTNKITVAEGTYAVMTDFAIADNYDGFATLAKAEDADAIKAAPTIDDETGNAVIDVTMNKGYVGTFYIIDASVETLTAGDIANTIVIDDLDTPMNVDKVTKASNFTNAALAKSAKQGLMMVNTDGSVSYKFKTALKAGETITRGTEYVLVFDQEDEVAAGVDLIDLNTTDAVTCPYVIAPDNIKVGAKASIDTAGWTAQLMYGETEAAWINGDASDYPTTNMGIVLQESANTTYDKNLTPFTGDYKTLVGGLTCKNNTGADSEAVGTDGQYAFATFTAAAGIFGEDAFTLVSSATPLATPVADGVVVAESSDDASDITVTFNNLKYDSTVMLIESHAATAEKRQAEIKAKLESGDFLAVDVASRGQAKLTFNDVVEGINDTAMGDTYYVYVKSGNDVYVDTNGQALVKQVASGYTLAKTSLKKDETASIAIYDQFGDEMSAMTAVASTTMISEYQAKNTAVAPKISIVATGVLTLDAVEKTAATEGDVFKYRMSNGQYLYAEADDGDGTDDATSMTLWIE